MKLLGSSYDIIFYLLSDVLSCMYILNFVDRVDDKSLISLGYPRKHLIVMGVSVGWANPVGNTCC